MVQFFATLAQGLDRKNPDKCQHPSYVRETLGNLFPRKNTKNKYLTSYHRPHVIVFDPVSDEIDNLTVNHLPSLKNTINDNADIIKHKFNTQGHQTLLFPVGEERNFLGFQRKHWVTLHYETESQVATVIDSRPLFPSMCYPISCLAATFNQALLDLNLGLEVKQFAVRCLGVQNDAFHCGSWTITFINTLAHGALLEDLNTFSPHDLPGIKAYLDSINNAPQRFQTPYTPLVLRSPLCLPDSCDQNNPMKKED